MKNSQEVYDDIRHQLSDKNAKYQFKDEYDLETLHDLLELITSFDFSPKQIENIKNIPNEHWHYYIVTVDKEDIVFRIRKYPKEPVHMRPDFIINNGHDAKPLLDYPWCYWISFARPPKSSIDYTNSRTRSPRVCRSSGPLSLPS